MSEPYLQFYEQIRAKKGYEDPKPYADCPEKYLQLIYGQGHSLYHYKRGEKPCPLAYLQAKKYQHVRKRGNTEGWVNPEYEAPPPQRTQQPGAIFEDTKPKPEPDKLLRMIHMTDKCGTVVGYSRHRDRGLLHVIELIQCGCDEAMREYNRNKAREHYGYKPAKGPVRHGTAAGYEKHQREGTLDEADECGCKRAHAEKARILRYKNKGKEVVPRVTAACGTLSGYLRHSKNGTIGLIDKMGCGCRDAVREYKADVRAEVKGETVDDILAQLSLSPKQLKDLKERLELE